MVIKEEHWSEIGAIRKKALSRCELCGREEVPENLRARHVQYGDMVEDKHMVILCQECNYRLHQAEAAERKALEELNRTTMAKVSVLPESLRMTASVAIMYEYMRQRADIISDAIISAVGLFKTRRRPVIDLLFTHPAIDEENVLWLCKELGAWDASLYARLTREKLVKIRDGMKRKAK